MSLFENDIINNDDSDIEPRKEANVTLSHLDSEAYRLMKPPRFPQSDKPKPRRFPRTASQNLGGL